MVYPYESIRLARLEKHNSRTLMNAYINQHLSILRTSAIEPRFLSAYLTSPSGHRQIVGKDRYGVKAGLNFDDVRSLAVPIPPRNLQEQFRDRVGIVERYKATYIYSHARLKALFASVQHRAFHGEL
jgi:type I restriction enzyme, S subunit